MKYFKPELIERYRSINDDIADAAAKEWEEAIVSYRARIKAIRTKLPAGVRRLRSRVPLHDSKIFGVAISDPKPLFSMLIQLEGTARHPGEVLELNYHSVAGPNGGIHFRMPTSAITKVLKDARILYDEFDVDETHGFFTHSILLNDWREFEIRFHNLSYKRLGRVYVPTDLTKQHDITWPLEPASA